MGDPLATLLIVVGVLAAAVAVIGTVSTGSAYKEIGRRKLAVGVGQEEIDAVRAAASSDSSAVPDQAQGADLTAAEEGWPVEDERTAELRQLLQARNERRARRGEDPLELESELQRLLAASADLPLAPEDRV
jgi:hypothetical protein